uniref:Uncharacterized protein n=1 Tax=Oryza meridionalis TaxID=40149 RepID=A0A0E0EMB0_9ORYZ
MGSEDKFDMLLRMLEECERRREEADQRRRADFLSLKAAIDSWMPQEQKKAEDLQFLVEDEQSKVTPTTCSMECPNGSSPSTTARSIYDDEGATPTIILELGDGEGKDRMPFIISKDLPELTPIMCLTKCSSLDVEPDFTVAAVVICSNAAMDSKELVATDGATGTTNIDPRVCSKETHTKCLLFGPDVNGVTDRGVIAFQSRMGVFKVVPISSQSVELMVDEKATCIDTTHLPKVMHPSHLMLGPNVNTGTVQAGVAYSLLLGAPEGIASSGKATLVMAQKLNSNFCLKWVALNRCSTKCSKGYKKLLMSHPKRNPWPPPCSGGLVRRWKEWYVPWAAGNYLGIIFYFMPPWPPPTQIGTIILWLLVNTWLTEVELKPWPDPQPSQYSGGVMWTEQVPWPAPVFAHLMGYDFCSANCIRDQTPSVALYCAPKGDLNHEKSDRAHKDTLVAIFNLEQFHYVGGEEKVTEGMLYGLSTVSCNYLIIPATTMTVGACWLEAQEGLNNIAKGRTYKICKSMRMTLNHVESWLQNPTNILYNGQLFNCPAGVHFGVRRISGIIARGAGENQNRKVKTCGYDSIFDFCENNPSDGSAAARDSGGLHMGRWLHHGLVSPSPRSPSKPKLKNI